MNGGNFGSDESENTFTAHKTAIERRLQYYMDRITPYTLQRWAVTGVSLLIFLLRIFIVQGWFIVTYALGIYLLNLLLAFLSPKFDPALELDAEMDEMEEGPALPTRADEEMRPFIRRLPEFKFWYWSTRAIFTAFVCSFIPLFDVPVYAPILIVYFILLFVVTMRRQIQHMIKYRYVPWTQKKSFRRGK
ncbi:uncharacterized protein VTP21DRAFT_5558 [Calcarisporiella thermophila]|uniref:uncharacterized protein n=1 Tax=Calcarisporiella thermophila TaxID=911321 RepID=UPI0037429033